MLSASQERASSLFPRENISRTTRGPELPVPAGTKATMTEHAAEVELATWEGLAMGDFNQESRIKELFGFSTAGLGRPPVIPPDRLAYLQQLIAHLLHGRTIVFTYNYILLGALGIFTAVHVLEKRRLQQEWRQRTENTQRNVLVATDENAEVIAETRSASSSSSNSLQIPTPSGATKDVGTDIERLPLLGLRRANGRDSFFARATRRSRCWLEYQPRPLPRVNKALPSNGTSLFVILWLTVNITLHLFQMPLEPKYFFCFASRAGDLFAINLPLLYLLAAKNQPLRFLTGRSYEALNIFHRRVGEWMCFEAFVHSLGMLIWRFALEPHWLQREPGTWAYLTHPLIYEGIGAFVSYEMLYFTSLGSFRQRWYEIFLASHVVLQILALVFLYLHFHTARPYVLASLAIFVADRLIWRIGLNSTTVCADLCVLPDGETVMLSSEWHPPRPASWWHLWPRQDVQHGWEPTDHVFLSVPALGLGKTHALQAHPFTIASAAPSTNIPERGHISRDSNEAPPASLDLLIRAHNGFTADLLCYAHRHRAVSVRLDGPYGSSHALDMLRAADNVVLVAGGSGIAVTFPLAAALLRGHETYDTGVQDVDGLETGAKPHGNYVVTKAPRKQTVRMLWVIHSDEHRLWVPQRRLGDLVAAGLELVISPPTSVEGRPDVAGLVQQWIDTSCDSNGPRRSAVAVSGPDGLNRTVRNTCAQAIGMGIDVRLVVEKFGW